MDRRAETFFVVNYISGNFDAAAKDYTESLKLDESFAFAHIQLGVVQYKLGSISSAMSTFNNALKKFPNSADVQNYYGELLVDQQKIGEAIEAFSKAIELDPKNPLPYINKAMLMYQAMGDANEATNLCKKALECKWKAHNTLPDFTNIVLPQKSILPATLLWHLWHRFCLKWANQKKPCNTMKWLLKWPEHRLNSSMLFRTLKQPVPRSGNSIVIDLDLLENPADGI